MSAGEFEDMYLRYLAVQRDFPNLDHRGHFDQVVKMREDQWGEDCLSAVPDNPMECDHRFYLPPIEVNEHMESIERDFERSA